MVEITQYALKGQKLLAPSGRAEPLVKIEKIKE